REGTERMRNLEGNMSFVPGYSTEKMSRHTTARLNVRPPEHNEGEMAFIRPDAPRGLELESKGTEAIVAAAIALALVSVAMSLSIKADQSRVQRQGSTLEGPGLFANRVRWGDPIPEIAGSPLVYPDYIAPPRRYYVNKREQWVDSLLCIEIGRAHV